LKFCCYYRAVEVAGGELATVETGRAGSGGEENTERALVVRAASPVKEEKKEEKAEAPAAAASPLDEVEVHDEPSVASQVYAFLNEPKIYNVQKKLIYYPSNCGFI